MFQAALERFAAARARTLSLVAGVSQEQMDFAAGPEEWSIGETADHLLLSEGLYRGQMTSLIRLAREGKKPILRVTVEEVNFSPFFLPKPLLPMFEMPFAVVTQFVPRAIKEFMIRYPLLPGQNPDVAHPAKGHTAETLRRELAASIQETTALLAANADLDYRRMITRHPLLGVNSIVDLLRILALHEQRHQAQIAAIRNNLHFPTAA